jgi:methyl-accepting chemotaxis protein
VKLSRSINLSIGLLLLVFVIGGVFVSRAYQQHVERKAVGHLTTMLMLRESVLRSYFESLRSEVTLWSSQPIVVNLLNSLHATYQARGRQGLVDADIGATQTSEMRQSINRESVSLDVRVAEFAAHHRYYDILFIGPNGDVLYTVAKEDDYGTNLLDGPYADSGLGRLFQYLHSSPGGDNVEFEDYSAYPPSNNEPAAFLGARVYRDGEYIGVYAVQIPVDPVDEIMQFSAGMGETGEIYLVGEDGLMRSDSRFFDTSSVLNTKVTGATVGKAFSGETGLEIVDDYRGVPVYSAYRLFEFEGIRWAVLAEQDVAEVEAPVVTARLWLGAGFAGLCLIAILFRFMLPHLAVPVFIAGLFGVADDDYL